MDIQQIVDAVLAEIHQKNKSTTETKTYPTETIHFQSQDMAVDNPSNVETIHYARSITPARIGIGRAGTRMKTNHYLQFRIDHAAAQDAVLQDVSEELLARLQLPLLFSKATSIKEYLMDLEAGRALRDDSAQWLERDGDKQKDVQIIISDGLSSSAIEANIESILPALQQGLALKSISVGKPIFIKKGRVWIQDAVAKIVDCKLAIILIGERPGLNTDESLSAYMIYKPNEKTVEADRTVISNIHQNGLAPTEAGAYLAELIDNMLKAECTGVAFARSRKG